jgi:hypothetical protein
MQKSVTTYFFNTTITSKYNHYHIIHEDMSTSDPSSNLTDGYICKICGLTFLTLQSLAAHIDSEHPEAEQPEVL